jgi:DNA polymerase-3 subunit delta'
MKKSIVSTIIGIIMLGCNPTPIAKEKCCPEIDSVTSFSSPIEDSSILIISKVLVKSANTEKSIKLIKACSHPNLLVIEPDFDAVKNEYKNVITIDKIRTINLFFNHTSFDYKNKVIIIDSIDLLNTNSINAILKALEEPPKNTFFLITCNNVHKLLDTIKSRCLLIKFDNLNNEVLEKIIKNNLKINISNIGLNYLEYLDGTLSNLNWILNNKNKNIINDIEDLFINNKIDNLIELKNRWGNIDEYSFFIIVNIIKKKLLSLYKNNNNFKIFAIIDYITSIENKIFTINLDVYSILLIICLSIYDTLILE